MKTFIVKFLAAVFIITAITTGACFGISLEKEEKLSKEFMESLLKYSKIIEDQTITQYIETVGQKIVAPLSGKPFEYKFYIIDDDQYNAFAAPGALIFINRGLFTALSSEEELSGILAHEAAHVSCRHISSRLEKMNNISIATLSGIVLSAFMGPAVLEAFAIGSVAAGQTAALAYSREDEIQADTLGLKYMKEAGYRGTGLFSSLKKIRDKQWIDKDSYPVYLSTHPAIDDRIAVLSAMTKEDNSKPIQIEKDYEFMLVATKLKALYGQPEAAISEFKLKTEKFPDNPVYQYGYGLALYRADKTAKALYHINMAIEKNAFEPNFLADNGRIYLEEGDAKKADSSIESCLCIDPKNIECNFLSARVKLEEGEFKKSIALFQKVLSLKADHYKSLYFLGSAYNKIGKGAYAHFYFASHYKLKRMPETALFHIKKAIELMDAPGMDPNIDPDIKEKALNMLEELNLENKRLMQEEIEKKEG